MEKSLQDISNYYFRRFGWNTENARKVQGIDPSTNIIIVIPVHNEPAVTATLDSLANCILPSRPFEVTLVVNNAIDAPNSIKKLNLASIHDITNWNKEYPDLNIRLIKELELPSKHAGVGLARKIGMDDALRRFSSINKNGLIVCLDADCTVAINYLKELELNFGGAGFISGNIHYEHVWENCDESLTTGIIKYELGLRYYVNALRFAGYPYAFHTIGSSMAVSAKTYALSGGMNKRKAGEDFYFLHKLIPLGGFRELNSTTVYPSARISERVPFGTGRAMLKWKDEFSTNPHSDLETYNLNTFEDLKSFLSILPSLKDCRNKIAYKEKTNNLPDSVQAFLNSHDFLNVLTSCIEQSTTKETFLKRIYAWLDGFRVLKYVHFSRDHFHPNMAVEYCATELLENMDMESKQDTLALLETFRKIDVTNSVFS